jgi:hypothetical protein
MEFYAYGEAKAAQVRVLAADRGYSLPHCYAYSDSVTDLPLLELVGHPRVVNPDRALRRVAAQRDWPVLSFSGLQGAGDGTGKHHSTRADSFESTVAGPPSPPARDVAAVPSGM